MTNFLITAANSDISVGITRILRLNFPEAAIIGVAPDGNLPSSYFFDKVYAIPPVSEFDSYKKILEAILIEHQINILCPISEKELTVYTKESYKPLKNILINPTEVLRNCLDKYKTYQWLKKIGVEVPETTLLSDKSSSLFENCIIKPRSSAGSKNMYYVSNKYLFDALQMTYHRELDSFVVQRCIGSADDEYTCALWRFNDNYREIILKRKLLGGLTGEAETVINSQISQLLDKIANNIEGNFFINVQLRLEEGFPFVFEINPRFSSTVMLRHKVGFQDVLWSFRELLSMDNLPYIVPKPGAKLFRISEELIIS